MANIPLRFIVFIHVILFWNYAQGQHLYDTTRIKKHYDQNLWALVNNSFQLRLQLSPNNTDNPNKYLLDFTQQSWLEYGVSYSKNNQRWYLSLFKIPTNDTTGKGDNDFYLSSYEIADKNYLFKSNLIFGKGFYDENTNNYSSVFDSTIQYLNQQDMTHISFNMSYWSFKNYKKFSYNAAYQYVQQQKKSAGSLFYMSEFSYTFTKNNQGLIPNYAGANFESLENMNVQNRPSIQIGGGITGTLVIKKSFFINGLALLKGGAGYTIYSSDEKVFENHSIDPLLGIHFQSSTGFNTKRFVVAYILQYNNNFFWNRNVSNSDSFLSGRLLIGYRFRKKT